MFGKKSIVIILALFIIAVFPVSAHANLESSEPAANAHLDAVPEEIRLFFTEPLEAEFSRIEVRNVQGEKLDLPAAEIDPNDDKQLVLKPNMMPDGVYTVNWRVVSQTDGHLTQGSFPFLIGEGSIGDLSSYTEDSGVPLFSSLIRWYNLFSLAWLVGAAAFYLFIWYPSVRDNQPELDKRLNRFMWFAWASVGLSSGLILLLQAQIVSGEGGFGLLNYVPQVLTTTRFGQLWFARIGLWGIFGLILWLRKVQDSRSVSILVVLGGAILITQSLFSHASGAEVALPSIVADWLHLVAMSVWIGSLIQFVLVIKAVQSTNRLAAMVARFSNMARVSVAMLVVTGFYAGWLQVGSVDALLNTTYGQALIVKLVLFLPLMAIAAINLFFTHKGLKTEGDVWSQRLRYLVSAEIALTIAILCAVGVMTAIVPARIQAASQAEPTQEDSYSRLFELAFEGDLMIQIIVEPGTVGENTFFIDLFDVNSGNPIQDASLIRLRFENEAQNSGESELRIESLTDGRYSVVGANLSSTGQWRIRTTIQRPNQFDTVVDFEPTISLGSSSSVSINYAPDSGTTGLALLVAGVAGVLISGVFIMMIRPMGFNPQTIFTVIFAMGSIFLVQQGLELRPSTFLQNPIPADSDSIAIGASLYIQNCSACHGLSGQGDGPAAISLDPPPADLSVHTVPGLHPDGELFIWISEGVSKTSAMPAFENVLSEDERWHVINYIRLFGE